MKLFFIALLVTVSGLFITKMAFVYHWGGIAERFAREAASPTTQPAAQPPDNTDHPDKPVAPTVAANNTVPPINGVSVVATPVASHVHPTQETPPGDDAAAQATADAANDQPVISLPIARAALDYVGVDPTAEVVWLTAINDPNMPADARTNLIENLDKSGFADPDHPSENDLSLIEYRLNLIEQIRPAAVDEVNAAALDEAYKSLSDLEAKLTPPAETDTPQPQMDAPQQ